VFDGVFSMLVTWRLLRQLEERVPDFRANLDALEQSVSAVLFYPDGSLEYESHAETQQLWAAFMPLRKVGLSLSFLGYIQSLPWFPASSNRNFKLISAREHETRLDPGGVLFAPRREICPPATDLTALHITVQFHRRIRRDAMPVLAGAVRDWHATVSETGLFGEGPVGQLSREIQFQGRCAQFSFDATRIGQRTINWLILSLLNASYDLFKPSAFIFDDVENLAVHGVEPSDEKIVQLPLGDHHSDPTQSTADGPSDSRLPAGLLPFPGQRSDHFMIWQTPSLEWESMRLAVYFEDWPNRDHQRDFRTLLGAWSVVAQAGGFGGEGGKHVGQPVFLKKLQAARVDADLGDADPDIAVPVLIRLLENYASGTLAIEAVVFGLDPITNFVI
jgi:hypothetical protein